MSISPLAGEFLLRSLIVEQAIAQAEAWSGAWVRVERFPLTSAFSFRFLNQARKAPLGFRFWTRRI
jgi:hypothetical protein